MKKVYLDKLPRRGKTNQISWVKSIGFSVGFEYDEIFGSMEIIDYNSSNRHIKLKYCEQTKDMNIDDLRACKISFVKDFYNTLNGYELITTKWNEKEISILTENYSDNDIFELSKLLPNRTKESIGAMARRIGLKKSELHMNKISMKNLGDYAVQNNKCEKHSKRIAIKHGVKNFSDVFILYKDSLDNGGKLFIGSDAINRDGIVVLFKYYLYKNNICHNREFWTNSILGSVLKRAKLKQRVKKLFSGYYDFITHCFPKYKFKEWEFKYLNVTDGFWENKYNRFHCIRDGIEKMTEDGVIEQKHDCLRFDFHALGGYFHSSLITYFGKSCIIEYLEYIKHDMPNDLKFYNGVYFDSLEERSVYIYIYENFVSNIEKCDRSYKFENKTFNEGYIPDFAITKCDSVELNKKIIIEYFGMYKDKMDNGYFGEYKRKTDRKIKFYNIVDDICFIPLFPNDIKNNFAGVRKKLTPFIMQKNLKGGEVSEERKDFKI